MLPRDIATQDREDVTILTPTFPKMGNGHPRIRDVSCLGALFAMRTLYRLVGGGLNYPGKKARIKRVWD